MSSTQGNTPETTPQSAIENLLQETRRSTDSSSARTATMLASIASIFRTYGADQQLVSLCCDQLDRNANQFGYAISQQAGQQTGSAQG